MPRLAFVCSFVKLPDLSSRPKTEDAWVFAKPSAIQALGVMSFGECMISQALSQYGIFGIMKKLHICVWRADVQSVILPINSIWSSLCQHKIRLKLFSLIIKIWFNLDKSLSYAENSLWSSCFLTWKSSKCYMLIQNLAHEVLQIGQMSKATLLHPRLERKPWMENIVLFRFPLRLEGHQEMENGRESWIGLVCIKSDRKRPHKSNMSEISHSYGC